MSSLLQMITNGEIVTARHFAEIERKARTEIQALEKEQLSNWVHTITSGIGVVGCLCLSPAAPIVAAVGGVAAVGAVLYGHSQFFGSKGIQLSRAKSIAQAMDDATEQQWESLFASCDDRDLFVNAFEAGLLEIAKGHPKHGDVFRKAAAYIHAANPDSIEGFTGRSPTALIAPVEGKVRSPLPVTDDEITHICTISAERITQSADRKWAAKVIGDASALRDTGNRQGATNKLIYNSRLTEREFAKEGITKARLKLIKEWAASGAPPTIAPSKLLALPPAAPIDVTVETPIVQTIAVAPTFTSFQRPIAPVEEELDYEIVEDYEEDEEPIAEVEVIPVAVKPAFYQVKQQRTPIAVSMSMVNGVEAIAPRDIATDLGNNPQSALVFGTPGAGKGMNISNAIRTLRAKLPNVTVMMVDPKGDKKERGYWESQVDIFESRSLLKSSPRSSAEWMMRCIEKFQNIDGPKLLVWDELFASITVLKGQNIPKGEDAFPCLTDFQQFISLNLSLGPSSGTWVWGMSQSANLSDLALTSGGLSTTRIIALISPDNVGAVEGYLATKAIRAPKGGMGTLDRLMESSPVGRACYDGKTKRWYPMARLENHSGFDRDSADWNNLGKVTQSSEPAQQSIELDDVWGDSDADDAVIETADAPDITSIKTRIARVMAMPGLSDDDKLDLIQTLSQHDRLN